MITYQYEKLNLNLFNELLTLLKASNEEVYLIKPNNKLGLDMKENFNVNYEHYLSLEKNNLLNICTARDDGKLVGHWTLNLYYHPQSRFTLVANCENLHILKEYRQNNTAINLMTFTENILKKRGVKIIYFGVNPQLKTDVFLRRKGWKLDEVVLTKEL